MSGDLIVGAVIVVIVAACIGLMVWQRMRGRSSCGCDRPRARDDGSCECCKDKKQ